MNNQDTSFPLKMFSSGMPTPEDVVGEGGYPTFPIGAIGAHATASGNGPAQTQDLIGAGAGGGGGHSSYWTPNAVGNVAGAHRPQSKTSSGSGTGTGSGSGLGLGTTSYDPISTYGPGYSGPGGISPFDLTSLGRQRVDRNPVHTSGGTLNTNIPSYDGHHQQHVPTHHRFDSTNRSLAPFSTLESSSSSSSIPSSSFRPRISDIGPPLLTSPYQQNAANFLPNVFDTEHGHHGQHNGQHLLLHTLGPGSSPGELGGGGLPSMFSMLSSPGKAIDPHYPPHSMPINDSTIARAQPQGEYAYPGAMPYGVQPGYIPAMIDGSFGEDPSSTHKGPYATRFAGQYAAVPDESQAPSSSYGDGHVVNYTPSDAGASGSASAVLHMGFFDRRQQPSLLSPQDDGMTASHDGYPSYGPPGPSAGTSSSNLDGREPVLTNLPRPAAMSKRKRGYSTHVPSAGSTTAVGSTARTQMTMTEAADTRDGFRRMRGGSKLSPENGHISSTYSATASKPSDTALPRLKTLLSHAPNKPDRPIPAISPKNDPSGGFSSSHGGGGLTSLSMSDSSRPTLDATRAIGSYAIPQRSREHETSRVLATLRESLPVARIRSPEHELQTMEAVQHELAGLQASLRDGLASVVANTPLAVWTQGDSGHTILQSIQALVGASRAVLDVMTSHGARDGSEPWKSPFSNGLSGLQLTPLVGPSSMPFLPSPDAATFQQARYPGSFHPESHTGRASLQIDGMSLPPFQLMAVSPGMRPNGGVSSHETSFGVQTTPVLDLPPLPASRMPPGSWPPKSLPGSMLGLETAGQVDSNNPLKLPEMTLFPAIPLESSRTVGAKREANARPKFKQTRSSSSVGKQNMSHPNGAHAAVGGGGKAKRVSHSPWTPEEAVRLAELAERSKGKLPGLDPTEVDWDYVVDGFKGTRSRHQVLIKAVYLGVKPTTTHASRLVRQKQYKGKEGQLGLSPEKIKRYLSLGGRGGAESEEMSEEGE